jgi:type I restriction enzyme, S subunit
VKFQAEADITGWKGRLQSGDLVINSTGTGTLGRAALFQQEGRYIADSHVTIVRILSDRLYAKYLLYLLQTGLYQGCIYAALVAGSTNQIELSRERLRATPILLPPLSDQKTIAAFLDRETANIDALIAKKARLIALLLEKRAALISRAVTRGLDPAVPTKDSGIEWLGTVPAHWDVERLKFRLNGIEQGWSPQCENRMAESGEWGVLKVGCMNTGRFNEDEHKALPPDVEPRREYEIHRGDVLMSRSNTRDLVGSVGRVHETRGRILLCDKLYRLAIDDGSLLPAYAVHLLRSRPARHQIERDASGASPSMQNISNDRVGNMVLAFPPVSEQASVVAHIDQATARFDRLMYKVEKHIDKLREYRAALISAAVAGSIDVRGEVG